MSRIRWNSVLVAAALLLGLPAAVLTAERYNTVVADRTGSQRAISLQDRLETGLKARRPEEFAYLADIAKRVEEGTLPRSLVDSTFFWARNKQPYPFPYFKEGLRRRAKKLGIDL